jgi:putative ABC transport system permease protein
VSEVLRTTLAEVRAHPTRLLGVLLAVALSVGFVVACLVFIDTQAASLKRSVAARTAGSSVVVRPVDDRDLGPVIADTAGVETVERSGSSWLDFSAGDQQGLLQLSSLPQDPRLRWMTLQDGAWPEGPDEIALDAETADRSGVGIGDTVRVQTAAADGREGLRDLRIVGLVDESASLFADLQSSGVVTVTSPLLAGATVEYLVIARSGLDPETLATSLQRRLPAETQVITSRALAAQQLEGLTGGVDVIRYLLLGFGSIAVLVGSMIISNIFGIVVAQRRRQIGLLRAIGATRSQVRRALLLEAVAVGAFGAALGLGLGIVIATAGAAISGSLTAGPTLRPLPLLLAAMVGLGVTLVSALAPARRAMVVSPLDALRPVAEVTTARRSGLVRSLVGGGLGLVGAATVAVALIHHGSGTLVVSVAGSALLAAAVIGLAPVYLPPVFRGVARLLQRSRPSLRLAAANTVRNPSRAAAVCASLMLGVGLIVTLQVGAASVESSTRASVQHEFPVDVIVRTPSGVLPTDVVAGIRELDGVRAAIEVPSALANVGDASVRLDGLGVAGGSVVATGLGGLDGRTALAHPFTLEMLGKADGDRIDVRVGARTESFVLRASDVADAGSLVITTQALERVAPAAPISAVWAGTRPGADAAGVMSAVRTVAADYPGLEIGGSLKQVAAITSVLDVLLQIATALTGVAVVIALVGMGNSLALSVIERGRESALLRALGLQRRQLRWMLAAEAVLLALIGAGVGVLAGIVFGMVGTAAMAAEGGFAETRFAVSGSQTAVVVAVAVIAGALASVLPGRRAARARPVEALAQA